MRKPFIAANWKMNKLVEEANDYGEELIERLKEENVDLKKVDVAVCVPYIHMAALKVIFVLRNIGVGAQNVYFEESGAYTGEISPAMLQDLGVEYCIIGHSERRQYFAETSEDCAKKVRAAVQHGIGPILCVGESLEERESGKYRDVIGGMLRDSLQGVTKEELLQSVIAYEPVWAIGTGKTATAEQAGEIATFIRSVLADQYDPETADQIRILYGGSVKPANIAEIMAMEDVDGALVGGAGLKADQFAKIVNFDPEAVGKDPEQ